MDNELISVIVPVYNVEKYLRKCLDSIISQTYRELEIILVDDGSTDLSGSICDEYSDKDNRIKVIHQANQGSAAARNTGLAIATGEYVGFIDSDDHIAKDMYEVLLNNLLANDCDIAIAGRYNEFEESGELIPFFTFPTPVIMQPEEVFRRLLTYHGLDSAPCDKLYRRKLFKGIEYPTEKKYFCEDIGTTYKLIERASLIVHCGKPLYYYLQRKGSISKSTFSEKSIGQVKYHKQVADYLSGKYPHLKEECDYFYYRSIIYVFILYKKSVVKCNEAEKLAKEISALHRKIIANTYLTKREKLHASLVKYRLINVAMLVYRMLH